jgi:predicted RNase H-like nuclease
VLVLGVDACPGGRWVAVPLGAGECGGPVVEGTFRDVLRDVPRADVVAVDVPIGCPPVDGFPRRADIEARRFVGPRASSVFPTLPREIYEATSYEAAAARTRQLLGSGLSKQSYATGRRILEVDSRTQSRVFEVHPEVSFAALARAALASKHTAPGLDQRRSLLAGEGIELPLRVTYAAPDDVLDAGVAAWSARRIARGEAVTLPADPAPGEPRIWF